MLLSTISAYGAPIFHSRLYKLYDAWKSAYEKLKRNTRHPYHQVFDYGTVPPNFHRTMANLATLSGLGLGVGGYFATVNSLAHTAEAARVAEYAKQMSWGKTLPAKYTSWYQAAKVVDILDDTVEPALNRAPGLFWSFQ